MAQKVRSCGIITLGAVIYALAFDWFVAPNQIAMGGVTGLAQIVNALVPVLQILEQLVGAGPAGGSAVHPCQCAAVSGGLAAAGRPPAGEQPVRHGSQFLGH